MPVLLAHSIEDSTDIFGISEGGFEHPKPPTPLGTPLYNCNIQGVSVYTNVSANYMLTETFVYTLTPCILQS